jgi:crotonobetainyl-CoA:carnitine CoA-transferase CaiB-like acyl-CoA transferase
MKAKAAMLALQAAGVAAAMVNRPSDILNDDGYIARGFWQEADRAVVGVKPHPSTPWLYNGARADIRWPSPLLGEHNRQVFHDLLGLTEAEIAALENAGVIGDTPYVKA